MIDIGNFSVMTAMSGGVDSSAAALLLKNSGHRTAGMTLRLFDPRQLSDPSLECPESSDVKDARKIAEILNIPFYCPDMSGYFRETVIKNFADTYLAAGTPNPCVLCNKKVKFGRLLEEAQKLGYDKIATGHYSSIEKTASGRWLLKKAGDESKDQSYVLYALSQYQLSMTVFPLGDTDKKTVRELVRQAGLPVFDKQDSQDICFVKDGDYRHFLEQFTGRSFPPGDFVDTMGNTVARHNGIVGYTVGQRKGLAISSTDPWYVLDKRTEDNSVVLCRGEELFSRRVYAENVNYIPFDEPKSSFSVCAKIRYRQKESPARVFPLGNGHAMIEFDSPQRAAAPGQSVVFYDGEYVLGGGIIIRKP